ncbi:hypothetical protein BGW37DRAFT_519492 [Umbelopsis sp. PMI_123]|nr:hypothetical protein BGW37DRAFT_519492 [Umbelopsis sp. PMI_123]
MVFNNFSIKSKNSIQADSAPSSSSSSASSVETFSRQAKQANIPKALSKYLADPMRTTNQPDVVGRYCDPMGGSIRGNAGADPMNTDCIIR